MILPLFAQKMKKYCTYNIKKNCGEQVW